MAERWRNEAERSCNGGDKEWDNMVVIVVRRGSKTRENGNSSDVIKESYGWEFVDDDGFGFLWLVDTLWLKVNGDGLL
ncbi:hypothetical protein RJT34_10961 [Clitoria ternatea]|uniref:Uncharacterized protein n=1 Tax=Clitoria ternatea TaxID=43366 RepID=A0AAN9PJ17_CLITE